MLNKDNAILNSLTDLDLSLTMEKNARDKYKALCKYLSEQGLESDFQPQGSFLIGTVIKPYRDGKNQDYDLDVLAILNRNKNMTNPKEVKNDVGDILKRSGIYGDKLKKEDRNCWTLQYAEVSDGKGFSLDVVPATDEIEEIKNEIILSGVDRIKAEKAVAITDKKDGYEWLSTNPLGFGEWFLDISKMHLTNAMKTEQFNNMPIDFRKNFANIEEIPTYYYRSNLQRAVQFIKRHRDVYYDRSNNRGEKPSSILISSLVADSVKDRYFLSVSEIIESFVNGYRSESISIMQNGQILNPVDLRDNLIDNYSKRKMNIFDAWIGELDRFIHLTDDKKFRQTIHNDINTNVFADAFDEPKRIVEPVKPWKE